MKTFHAISSSGNITVGKLNNIDMNLLILLNKEQAIPVTLTFKKLTAKKDVSVGHFVNDYRLRDKFINTLFVSCYKYFSNKKILKVAVFSSMFLNCVITMKITIYQTIASNGSCTFFAQMLLTVIKLIVPIRDLFDF